MRVPHLSSVWQAEQSERARGQRTSGLVRLAALTASLVGSMLLFWGGAQAVAACPGACGTQATATGLATLPAWAVGKRIHFFASPNARSALAKAAAVPRKHGRLERRCEGGYCPKPPLLYKESGKGVQHSPKVYVIFWGKNWTVAPGSETRTQLLQFYEGLSGSAYQGILTQYFDATGRVSSSVSATSYIDTSVSAPTSVNDEALQNEILVAVAANKWTREFNDQFVVIPAPGSTYEAGFDTGFCGYHGVTSSGESSYTFVPYIGSIPFVEGCSGFDTAHNVSHVTSMVAAHEFAESATDPTPEGTSATWQTSNEYEIGDICATGDVELPNKTWAQGLWDDHQTACSISDKEPPHAYALDNPASNIEYTGAVFHGVVNPEGLETKYHWEYGVNSLSSSTPEVSAGSGVKNVTVSQSVSGLQADTSYEYRLVVTNSTGTTYGAVGAPTYGTYGEFGTPSPYWSIQTTPNPSEATHSHLEGVSCTSSTACTAVGRYSTQGTFKALAEFWNGSEWKIQSTPNLSSAVLSGVSCSSSTACIAVGGSESNTLAESWNGTEWKVLSTPNPSEATASGLNGVSCTSSTACVAVGSSYQRIKEGILKEKVIYSTLAEFWNGIEWKILSPRSSSGLSGVSCSSSTACIAVGNGPVAQSWNGTEWKGLPIPNPSEAAAGDLSGVSCTSSTACTAVGYYYRERQGILQKEKIYSILAEYWNGSEWKIEPTSNPSGSEVHLSGVSCSSSTVCTAVGGSSKGEAGGSGRVLAELWNGSTWVSQPPTTEPGPHATGSQLLGVSCWSTAACEGVGEYAEPVEVGGQKVQEEFTLAELDS